MRTRVWIEHVIGTQTRTPPVDARRPRQLPWCLPVLCASMCLASCEAYRPAPVDPARSARELDDRPLASGQAREALDRLLPQPDRGWPPSSWNRAQLLVAGLAQNPQLAWARAEQQRAVAQSVAANLPADGSLLLQTEYARREQHPWLYGVAGRWPLWTATQRRESVRAIAAVTEQARLEFSQAVWQLRRELIAALSDRESAQRELAQMDGLDHTLGQLHELQQARIAAGEDAPDTALALDQERAALLAERAEAQQRLAASQAAVAQCLGITAHGLGSTPLSWPEWGEPPPVDAALLDRGREQALLMRPDLAAAVQAYTLAESALALALREQYPRIELQPGYYWDHGIAKLPFDVEIGLPRGRVKAGIDSARAARSAAGAHLLALQARIGGEIDAAREQERRAAEAVKAALVQLAAADRAEQLAETAWQTGAVGRASQLTALLLRQRAGMQSLQRRMAWQRARNELEAALYQPLSGPELALSSTKGWLDAELAARGIAAR